MSGISLPGSRSKRPDKVETPSERYERRLKGVPERYAILQVGVALFIRNPKYGEKKDGDSGGDGGKAASSTCIAGRGQLRNKPNLKYPSKGYP